MTIHINEIRPDIVKIRIVKCHTCQVRRRLLFEWQSDSYYSPIWTCLTCGDAWGDGYRMGRPLARGWRAKSVAQAKARFKAWKDRKVSK